MMWRLELCSCHISMSKADAFLGFDIGSTTVKAVVLDGSDKPVYTCYRRHLSEVRATARQMLSDVASLFPSKQFCVALTGSGAISLAEELGVPFVQEVVASGLSIRGKYPDVDVAIELGGEDAKLTFFTGGVDQRMNETCAGGTGAFIDQMAAFLGTDAAGLDALAAKYTTIFPIASRCGVFARTDIVPLLNEGCAKEDIAASVMQAVVNQTISGLARGREIAGKVIFLGGPLAFLDSLRQRFVETLHLDAEHGIFPEHAEYYVAVGAAMYARLEDGKPVELASLIGRIATQDEHSQSLRLPPLFASAAEYLEFKERHAGEDLQTFPLEEYHGDAWLGFDSGSTTFKTALIDDCGRLLYTQYGSHRGDPLPAALSVLRTIYTRGKDVHIRAAAVTGYGSGLLKAALKADIDEVETVAHFTGARFFDHDVSFILDIGGQDIKCMRIRDGAIDRISLNEACSSGCGAFIENFAESLNMTLPEFVAAALKARHPVDLGTRCTVFMNSKVKQAQKEGADVGDIAAGLSYSVVRNACYKVIKISDPAELGSHVVAQGGSFVNDALLRALELQLGRDVVRPGKAGLMGAFGAALIARERGPAAKDAQGEPVTELLGPDELDSFRATTRQARCHHCTNACRLTLTTFQDGRRFISGNRCERGGGGKVGTLPNVYAYKYKRLFEPYVPLPLDKAPRGRIGVPRCLNMFENYPLWFTLLTKLGFRVELSSPSSKELYFQGYGTIPSQTVCYPAKLAHGHILDLIARGLKVIFYPCILHEQLTPKLEEEFGEKGRDEKKPPMRRSQNQSGYNCPVVAGYPELLAKNIDLVRKEHIEFIYTYVPLDRRLLSRRLRAIPFFADIPEKEMDEAVRQAFAEQDVFKADIRRAGEQALHSLEQSGNFGVILSGHPYHVDPEIHHGIADLVVSCGMAVLTEDSVAHLARGPIPLRVVDQWTFHGRLYRAGAVATQADNLAVLQLVSFGCGLDAITTDQLEEIVTNRGRLYAQIKIDEGANLGPARIRIRSLLAALRERATRRPGDCRKPAGDSTLATPPPFTEAMRSTHTILVPQLSPVHFRFLAPLLSAEGYNVAQLPKVDRRAVELGLRYVNNDACYPAIVVIGQLLEAVYDGGYPRDKVALMLSQTGGGCRASNYIWLLRKALVDAGLNNVPVISCNLSGLENNPGFHITKGMLWKLFLAGFYADALMRMLRRVSPYEAEPGSAKRLAEVWTQRGLEVILKGGFLRYNRTAAAMVRAFDSLPLRTLERRPRVGLVGEILLKYHPDANNHAVAMVEQEGGEVVVPDLMDFVLYSFYDGVYSYRHLAGNFKTYVAGSLGIWIMELCRIGVRRALARSQRFTAPLPFAQLRHKAQSLMSLGHQTGEGWLLVGEMAELLESGVNNILCMQPFGCLPNHITGKGAFKLLKQRFPQANITAVDYDPGASEVNQINRIKLMMSVAK